MITIFTGFAHTDVFSFKRKDGRFYKHLNHMEVQEAIFSCCLCILRRLLFTVYISIDQNGSHTFPEVRLQITMLGGQYHPIVHVNIQTVQKCLCFTTSIIITLLQLAYYHFAIPRATDVKYSADILWGAAEMSVGTS